MSVAVTRSPTAVTVISGTWTNPTNVLAVDVTYANVTVTNVSAAALHLTGFGFDANIPQWAIIDDVSVEMVATEVTGKTTVQVRP